MNDGRVKVTGKPSKYYSLTFRRLRIAPICTPPTEQSSSVGIG